MNMWDKGPVPLSLWRKEMNRFPLEFDDKSKESTFTQYSDYQNRVFNRMGIISSTIGWLSIIIIFYFTVAF